MLKAFELIDDMQRFPNMLSSVTLLQDDKEDKSYDVELLFANIPIEKSINHITEQIYIQQKLAPICSKLTFRRLLIKHIVLLNLTTNF